jgi:hypothetical protein
MKKYPDQIVYNEETQKYDSNTKNYPTTVGSQKFEPIVVDKSDAIKSDRYFNSKLDEIKREYETLVNVYENTKMVYNAEYSFQPVVGEIYHLYEKEYGYNFLSIIKPTEWNKKHIGSYRLLNNGVWELI